MGNARSRSVTAALKQRIVAYRVWPTSGPNSAPKSLYAIISLSNAETDWPGGGMIGIHGTDEASLIPGHPSHGCIRVPNCEIVKLARLLPIGTPLTIE